MHIAISIVLIFIVCFLISVIVSWIVISRSSYSSRKIAPGQPYEISGRKYICPNIDITGDCYILKDQYFDSLRDLLVKTIQSLDDAGMKDKFWMTGGTLLGIVRHNGAMPMPWDDDFDMAVELKYKEFLFSPEFSQFAENNGLRTIRLSPNTKHKADRNGAAVRLQHSGQSIFCDY